MEKIGYDKRDSEMNSKIYFDIETAPLDDGTLQITAYNGELTAFAIPDSIGGKTVSSIGDSAFAGNSAITSVTIPDSVTSIGEKAFSDCSKLSEIIIPSTVDAERFHRSLGADMHDVLRAGKQ